MKFDELLAEVIVETETYLEESVVKKGKKFYCMKNGKDEILPGTKEEGYYSLENASKAMLNMTSKNFSNLPFTSKKKRLDRYMKTWKSRNGVKDSKKKKKYGFEIL